MGTMSKQKFVKDYGWLAWKDFLLRVSKTLNMEGSLLLEFDKLWGARHIICCRSGKKILLSFERPKCGVVRWVMCGALGPLGFGPLV